MQKRTLAIIFLTMLVYISLIPMISYTSSPGIINYQVHVRDYGWLPEASGEQIAGTTGEGRRMEAIKIDLDGVDGILKYQAHVEHYGWLPEVSEGQVTGTTGQSRRIEAIQIVLEKNNEVIDNKIVKFGIDVSKHQGEIDWSQVKTSGVKFAMIRCGYRGYTEGNISEDIQFINNIKGAYQNGIKVGLYFYSSAINEAEAVEEANFVLSLINKYGIKDYISYPIVIDVEDFEGTRNYHLSVEERTNVVKAFCNTIKNAGYKPMLYSYTYFLENRLDMDQLASYDTWIADYYGNSWYTRPFTIWQYTDKGSINGIQGNVDLNYSYKNY